eukprot:Skav231644  [mRNA]  locus=scaffold3756:39550:54869:+ [translate_table: standard]
MALLESKLAAKLDGVGSPSSIARSEEGPGNGCAQDGGGGPDPGTIESSKPSSGFPLRAHPEKIDEQNFLASKTKTINALLSRSEHPGFFDTDDVGKSRLPSPKTKEFRSLEDAMQFPKHFVEQLLSEGGECPTTLSDLVHYLEETTHSSSFSGVGAPETALMLLHHQVQQMMPERKVKPPQFTSFIEWDAACQAELSSFVDKLGQDTCIFSDIAGFFAPHLTEIIQELYKKPSFAIEVLAPMLLDRTAMRRKAWCVRHRRNCHIRFSKRHGAGSSCTAHSKQGKQLALADRNVIHLLAFMGLRLELQEQEIDLENVELFPTPVLERILGSMYVVDWALLDPRMVGFPSARVRKYHRLRHKQAALSAISPLSCFVKRFYRAVNWTWREYLTTHVPDEYRQELEWAQQRPMSIFHAFSDQKDKIDNLIKNYGVERVLAVEKKLGSRTLQPEEGEPGSENEDGDEAQEDLADDDEVMTTSGSVSAAANVDAALMALKTQKEKRIGKKIEKRMKAKAAKKATKKKGSSGTTADASATAGSEPEKTLLDLQECAEFSMSIFPLKAASGGGPKESRIKHCLDDFLTSLQFCRRNLAVQIEDDEAERSKKLLVSLFLELSWGAQVAINGKAFKVYSVFREEAHKLFYAAHQRLKIGQTEFDPLKLARDLMSAVTAPDALEEDNPAAALLMKPLILAKHVNLVFPTSLKEFEEMSAFASPYFLPDLDIVMSSPWLKIVQKGLEAAIWRIFNVHRNKAEDHVMYVADPNSAGLKAEKAVLVNAPEGTDLMFAGPITMDPGLNSLKVAEIGGVPFYMNPTQAPPAGEVFVPAWLAKPTPKKDNVTVAPWMSTVTMYVDSFGGVTTADPNRAWQLYKKKDQELVQLRSMSSKYLERLHSTATAMKHHLGSLEQRVPTQEKDTDINDTVRVKVKEEVPEVAAETQMDSTLVEPASQDEKMEKKAALEGENATVEESSGKAEDKDNEGQVKEVAEAEVAEPVPKPELEANNTKHSDKEESKDPQSPEEINDNDKANKDDHSDADSDSGSDPDEIDLRYLGAAKGPFRVPSPSTELLSYLTRGKSEEEPEPSTELIKTMKVEVTLHMLSTTKDAQETPLPLLRPMTPEEVSAKAARVKREVPEALIKLGLVGAVRTRELLLENNGEETATMKKRRKKDEQGAEKTTALKVVKGGHLLK